MLYIFSQTPHTLNASMYYRILQPMSCMIRHGLAECFVDKGYGNNADDVNMALNHADLSWFGQLTHPSFSKNATISAGAPSYWRHNKTWAVGPVYMMDTDDDLFNVMPTNPAYKTLGFHDGNGNEVPQRGGITAIATRDDGSQFIRKYIDGQDGFSVNENKERLDNFRLNLSVAGIVTTTTPKARKYILREAPNAHVVVHPNCPDLADYPEIELADHPDEVRILWAGGDSHLEDFLSIREPLQRVMEKYPQTKLILWGSDQRWIRKSLPAGRTKYLPWVAYEEYKLRLNFMNHDIALAPLTQTRFNESRSEIKMSESAACWKPAVCLAQNWGPYPDTIIEGETGLLFNTPEEFEQKLSRLVEDAAFRKQLAANAKDWVRTERDPMKHAEALAGKFQEVVDLRRSLKGEPPLDVPQELDVAAVPSI